jgi:competence protein ComEA
MVGFLSAGLLVWALPPKSPEPPEARTVRTESIEKIEEAGRTEETGETEKPEMAESEAPLAPSFAESPKDDWFLYITGSVRTPGVYRLPPGARLVHLVEAAGGLNGLADSVAVNLAAPLEDGMHVHVPRKGERTPERPVILEVPLALVPNHVSATAGATFRKEKASEKVKEKAEDKAEDKAAGNRRYSEAPIDINRATAEELILLKGIGPVLAKNIVEYRRKNGPFGSVEELVRVKGIGVKKLEGFRDRVVARP